MQGNKILWFILLKNLHNNFVIAFFHPILLFGVFWQRKLLTDCWWWYILYGSLQTHTHTLLCTTSLPKALAACGWIPTDFPVRYLLMTFVTQQLSHGRSAILELLEDLGVNQRISSIDIASSEFRPLERLGFTRDRVWNRLEHMIFLVPTSLDLFHNHPSHLPPLWWRWDSDS